MQTPTDIQRFLDNLEINGKSPNTIRAYRADLNDFYYSHANASEFNCTQIELAMARHLTDHKHIWSINTLNRKLACFRAYGKFHWNNTGFLASYKRPASPPGVAHPILEGVDGVLAMIEVARKPHHKSLIALTGLLGLRVAEARSVELCHYADSRSELTVIGKGEKTRTVPVSDHAYGCLVPRIVEIYKTVDHIRCPYTRFVPLSDRAARVAITTLAKRAGLANPVSSHDLRMTFGTVAYYNSGGDIRSVQELLGHASSHTTENYTATTMEKMREAADITRSIS